MNKLTDLLRGWCNAFRVSTQLIDTYYMRFLKEIHFDDQLWTPYFAVYASVTTLVASPTSQIGLTFFLKGLICVSDDTVE